MRHPRRQRGDGSQPLGLNDLAPEPFVLAHEILAGGSQNQPVDPALDAVAQRHKPHRHNARRRDRADERPVPDDTLQQLLDHQHHEQIDDRDARHEHRIDQTLPDDDIDVHQPVLHDGVGDDEGIDEGKKAWGGTDGNVIDQHESG